MLELRLGGKPNHLNSTSWVALVALLTWGGMRKYFYILRNIVTHHCHATQVILICNMGHPDTWISSKSPTFEVETFRSPSEIILVETVSLVSLGSASSSPGGAGLTRADGSLHTQAQVVLAV